MTNEIVKYEIEDPLTGTKKMTRLRAKAIGYHKKNFYVTEHRMIDVTISERESIVVLHTKAWKPKTE